jgi:hypothetical protein
MLLSAKFDQESVSALIGVHPKAAGLLSAISGIQD